MNRREFSKSFLTLMASYCFLDQVYASNSYNYQIKENLEHWVVRLNTYCKDLKSDSMTVLEWQQSIADLFADVPLEDILAVIDLEKLKEGMKYPDLGVTAKQIKFPSIKGLPEKIAFYPKIFGLKKDRSIIPHGHSNMASAHLVLDGEMHLRQYEKMGENEESLIILPTVDRLVQPSDLSSISDERNNVHWFISNSDFAHTFDVIMLDLNEKQYDIHNIDIHEKIHLGNQYYEVPKLDVEQALKKYGKHTHH